MSDLDAAQERLEIAISRLQTVVGQQGGATAPTPPNALVSELAVLKAENATLRQSTDDIAGHLDGVIGRLRLLLDG